MTTKARCETKRDVTNTLCFLEALTDEQFALLGLLLGNYPKHRTLLILSAPSEQIL